MINFLVLGEVLFIFSTSSSSFIEEEHQIWYYLGNSAFLILVLKDYKTSKNFKVNLLVHALFLFSHAVIRRWNQTGDKWLSISDIGDWLVMEENVVFLNICFVFGLLLAFLFLMKFSTSSANLVFVVTALVAIFVFRMEIFKE